MSDHFDAHRESPTLRKAQLAFNTALIDALLPELRMAARGSGYAIAIHGTLARDIDLVAIPWTNQADDPDFLVDRLLGVIAGHVGRAVRHGKWTEKPHGRRAVTIIHSHMGGEIDLSVMPRATSAVDEDEDE